MAFHEVRLPARLAFGSTGGVERRTEIAILASGHERRSTPWAMGRRRYLIGANLRSLDDMAELTAFFDVAARRIPSPCTLEDALQAFRVAEACEVSRAERRVVDLTEIKGA